MDAPVAGSSAYRWQCVAEVLSGSKRPRPVESQPPPGGAALQEAVRAASALPTGGRLADAVAGLAPELGGLPLWVELAIGRGQAGHPWHQALAELELPNGAIWWTAEELEPLAGTEAGRAVAGVIEQLDWMLGLAQEACPGLGRQELLWGWHCWHCGRWALPPGVGLPAGFELDGVCAMLLAYGQCSNAELLLLEGRPLEHNPYDSTRIWLEHQHKGDQQLLRHKQRLLHEADDLPDCALLPGSRLRIGPFVVRRSAAAAEALSFLPEELMVGGVPLGLLWAVGCLQVQELGQPPDTGLAALDQLAELLQQNIPSCSEIERPAELYKREVAGLLREALGEVARVRREHTPLSERHAQVHELDQVLSANQCAQLIKAADAKAAADGWCKHRHIAHPTTDMPAGQLGLDWLEPTIKRGLLPRAEELFGIKPLRVDEMFVARYDCQGLGQRSLGEHVDGSPWSFVLALNSEFEGGGTQFVQLEDDPVFVPYVGGCIVFSGRNRHLGRAISSGVRYILAGFLEYEEDPPDSRSGSASPT